MGDLPSESQLAPYGEFMLPLPREIINAHLSWMSAGAFAKNTIEDVERVLHYADAHLPSGLIHAARQELVTFLARDDWSPQTKATYRQHICRFFAWATDEDDPWLSMNPAARLRRPKVNKGVPNPATDAQTRAAITRAAMPFRVHCLLAAYAGLRCIEVARLHREHVTAEEVRLFGKGDKPAIVPTHPLIWAAIRDLPEGPVTRTMRGRPASDHWVSDYTSRHLQRELGLPITMHRLRAWFITMIQRTYKDATVTQRLARHASLNTTQGYVLVVDQATRDAVAGLPDLTDS